jgi:hypothetical protein
MSRDVQPFLGDSALWATSDRRSIASDKLTITYEYLVENLEES